MNNFYDFTIDQEETATLDEPLKSNEPEISQNLFESNEKIAETFDAPKSVAQNLFNDFESSKSFFNEKPKQEEEK